MSWLRVVTLLSFKNHNPGWEIRLHDTADDIKQKTKRMGQQADWTAWRHLYADGGFRVDSDIVFVAPVPSGWLSGDLCAQTGGMPRVWQFAMLGATPGHPFLEKCNQYCEAIEGNSNDYQALGAGMFDVLGDPRVYAEAFIDIPNDALCSFAWDTGPGQLWGEKKRELKPGVVGVHWYGGAEEFRGREATAEVGGGTFLEQLATDQLLSARKGLDPGVW